MREDREKFGLSPGDDDSLEVLEALGDSLGDGCTLRTQTQGVDGVLHVTPYNRSTQGQHKVNNDDGGGTHTL